MTNNQFYVIREVCFNCKFSHGDGHATYCKENGFNTMVVLYGWCPRWEYGRYAKPTEKRDENGN